LVDTLAKGSGYFTSLGIEYPLRLTALFVLCVVAGWTRNHRFHLAFAALYLLYYISWILRLYNVLE
jgi:hypothetical protein